MGKREEDACWGLCRVGRLVLILGFALHRGIGFGAVFQKYPGVAAFPEPTVHGDMDGSELDRCCNSFPVFCCSFLLFPFSTNCSTHCIGRRARVVVSMMGSRDYCRGSAGHFYVRSLFFTFFFFNPPSGGNRRTNLTDHFSSVSSPISADFRACSLYEVGFCMGVIIERRVWNEMGVRMPVAQA